jgi:hypothetical protein
MNKPRDLRIIGTQEVRLILGKSESQSRRLLGGIRAYLGKEKHQEITLPEFCAYKGLSEDAVCVLFGWN